MQYIVDLYPAKAQFLSGEPVRMIAELNNPTSTELVLDLEVKVYHWCDLEENLEYKRLVLPADDRKTVEIGINPNETDFAGYGVDLYLFQKGKLLEVFSGSFDLASSWRRSPRYGFLADFHERDRGDLQDIQSMCKLHLNLVQFYDWMYRHDQLIPPQPEYEDLMGRRLNLDVVKEKVHYCHLYGMKAIAYGAVYAASPGFFNEHRDWAFYDSNNRPFNLGELFYIMNIAPESPWTGHIIGQYQKAITEAGFDGIHMDTYGFPKTAISKLNGAPGKVERLEELFPSLIRKTREQLQKINPDVALIFNAVGNWPVHKTADTPQDVVYIEVWKPYEKYHHLQQIILWAKYFGKKKPVILAAYLKPFEVRDNEAEKITKAETAFLCLAAVIYSHGAYHLILGEENGILTEGYYVNYRSYSRSFQRRVRNYYDFFIRYADIFFDDELTDVSMTHLDGDNLEYVPEFEYSAYGEPGKVWLIIREKPGLKAISFINLTNNDEDFWNRGKNIPEELEEITIRVQVIEEVKRVFTASPDIEMGRPSELDFRIEKGGRGKELVITIPRLKIWGLLVIQHFN